MGSEGGAAVLVSSVLSEGEDVVRRPIKDVGEAEETVIGWGIEKAILVDESGGLNKLSLERSSAADDSVDFWIAVPKLHCAGSLSPKVNVVLVGVSLASC